MDRHLDTIAQQIRFFVRQGAVEVAEDDPHEEVHLIRTDAEAFARGPRILVRRLAHDLDGQTLRASRPRA